MRITSERFAQALAAAGVIDDLDRVRRIVIDVEAGEAVMVYVDYFGDDRLLQVARSLEGVEITGVPA